MARYKVSNKNIYGFKDNLYQMFLLIPIIWILALLVEFVLGPVLYGVYEKDAILQEGMAGSEAGGEIPVAESIEDMERFGTFTMIVSGTVLKYDTFRIGEEIYHRIELPSGEKVFAHINKKAMLETNKVGVYRLPAGE